MKFQLFEGQQRSPEWFKLRRGRVSSSRLGDWMATSKAKGKEGQPLKARKDYEKELMFEKQFDVNYDFYVSEPMQDGIDYEAFALQEYERITGNSVEEVGGWYSERFFSSTDGEVTEKGKKKPEGISEVKILRDNSWTDLLDKHEPKHEHILQMQGGLLSSKHKWCDYIALHLKTKRILIIRVKADKELMKEIEESLKVDLSVEPYDLTGVYEFQEAIPEDQLSAPIQNQAQKNESDILKEF